MIDFTVHFVLTPTKLCPKVSEIIKLVTHMSSNYTQKNVQNLQLISDIAQRQQAKDSK